MCRKVIVLFALWLLFIALWNLQSTGLASAAPDAGDTLTMPAYFIPVVMVMEEKPQECTPSFAFIPSADENNELAIFHAMNQERASFGLPPFVLNADLTQSSRLHSRDMANNNFTEHEGSDGSDAGERILRTCYVWTTWGENIGWGYNGDVEQMMNWWMNSPPHREAILSPDYRDVGVGYIVNPNSEWGHYWTVNFGTR